MVYSQLSRKRPPLVHDKVVAYGRWLSMGKNKNKTQTKLINVITQSYYLTSKNEANRELLRMFNSNNAWN